MQKNDHDKQEACDLTVHCRDKRVEWRGVSLFLRWIHEISTNSIFTSCLLRFVFAWGLIVALLMTSSHCALLLQWFNTIRLQNQLFILTNQIPQCTLLVVRQRANCIISSTDYASCVILKPWRSLACVALCCIVHPFPKTTFLSQTNCT